MKKRCYNAAAKNYRLYGSRGIVMAPRWLVFENFLQDMGERPAGFSIERIKNDGNYTPRNCRWASRAEQSRNTRQNRFVTVRGKRLCLNDAARNLGISPSAPYARARYYNISLQEAVDHYVARE
jgi:hypothetical protein